MKRRQFLKAFGAIILSSSGISHEAIAGFNLFSHQTAPRQKDDFIKDYLHKMQNFDSPHPGDIYLNNKDIKLLKSCVRRLEKLQSTVGHGNFYLLNFDDALKVAKNYSIVGSFSKDELNFMEMIFYEDGAHYGFLGEKVLINLTDQIKKQKVVKIPGTGNYLYKGEPLELYNQIKQEIGDNVILTSGIRSVMKQFLLFLNKANRNGGNLSLASRSLAPPGYSFHGAGDFDVGQRGFGAANFTEQFAYTKIYKKLTARGYVTFRYDEENLLGVRFEPWHVKTNV